MSFAAPALPFISAGAGLVGAYGTYQQGKAQREAYAREAGAAEFQRTKLLPIQINQQVGDEREDLDDALSALEAMRASRNTSRYGGGAIERSLIESSDRNVSRAMLGFSQDSTNLSTRAVAAARAGDSAYKSGMFGAIGQAGISIGKVIPSPGGGGGS